MSSVEHYEVGLENELGEQLKTSDKQIEIQIIIYSSFTLYSL